LATKIFRGLVCFVDCVSCSKHLAVGGVNAPVYKIFTEHLARVLVYNLGFVDKKREFHDPITEHVVDDKGQGQSFVDSQMFEKFRRCISGHDRFLNFIICSKIDISISIHNRK